jgi:hypothetical protein
VQRQASQDALCPGGRLRYCSRQRPASPHHLAIDVVTVATFRGFPTTSELDPPPSIHSSVCCPDPKFLPASLSPCLRITWPVIRDQVDQGDEPSPSILRRETAGIEQSVEVVIEHEDHERDEEEEAHLLGHLPLPHAQGAPHDGLYDEEEEVAAVEDRDGE